MKTSEILKRLRFYAALDDSRFSVEELLWVLTDVADGIITPLVRSVNEGFLQEEVLMRGVSRSLPSYMVGSAITDVFVAQSPYGPWSQLQREDPVDLQGGSETQGTPTHFCLHGNELRVRPEDENTVLRVSFAGRHPTLVDEKESAVLTAFSGDDGDVAVVHSQSQTLPQSAYFDCVRADGGIGQVVMRGVRRKDYEAISLHQHRLVLEPPWGRSFTSIGLFPVYLVRSGTTILSHYPPEVNQIWLLEAAARLTETVGNDRLLGSLRDRIDQHKVTVRSILSPRVHGQPVRFKPSFSFVKRAKYE